MMTMEAVEGERVLEVAIVEPRFRHTLIRQLFETLPVGGSLQLLVDHEPRPLHMRIEAHYSAMCSWTYLEQGPDMWRVRLVRQAAGAAEGAPPAEEGRS